MHKYLLKSEISKEYEVNITTLRRMFVKIGIAHKDKYITPKEYERFVEHYGRANRRRKD